MLSASLRRAAARRCVDTATLRFRGLSSSTCVRAGFGLRTNRTSQQGDGNKHNSNSYATERFFKDDLPHSEELERSVSQRFGLGAKRATSGRDEVQRDFRSGRRRDTREGGARERVVDDSPIAKHEATLFLANLPWKTTEDELREFFGEDKVADVKLAVHGNGLPAGTAHVQFASVDDARNVLDEHRNSQIYLGGRGLTVLWAVSKDRVLPQISTVFIGALPSGTTEDDLRRHIGFLSSPSTDISHVHVRDLQDGSASYAYVTFSSQEQADAFVQAHRTQSPVEVGGKRAAVFYKPTASVMARRRAMEHMPPSPTLFVGNLSFQAEEEDVQDLFEDFGVVESVTLGRGKDGRMAGFAHVEFKSIEDALRAMERHQESPLAHAERTLTLDWAHRPSWSPQTTPDAHYMRNANPPTNTLFLGNLPFNGTVADLEGMMRNVGDAPTPKEVRIAMSPDGSSRGFGHMKFDSVEEAQRAKAALEAERAVLGGRRLVVDFAPEREHVKRPVLVISGWEGSRERLEEIFEEFKQDITTYLLRSADQDGGKWKAPAEAKKQEAFVYFKDVGSAERARKALNQTEIAPGEVLHIGVPKSYPNPNRVSNTRNKRGKPRYGLSSRE
ncbi:RNA-binding domain-containing protein [Punctularia strigosozonata HHB-11173 SS5]|uniref:RNA-binding domain-containing protein n=1 Tax=Punctularia strigosozonata (strain HHB-11173) TaxID=741275 RepID=UPI0004417408|nr:RNA-binding domain-containing protein [Punctularia strigosozonata HHB-11173 SS5]EIN05726.1 RNA-binding domain-containing protein [Punctularia strigosozonata HHB-11173 SS5]